VAPTVQETKGPMRRRPQNGLIQRVPRVCLGETLASAVRIVPHRHQHYAAAMSRRYQAHEHRRVQCLDGLWDFAFLGDVDLDAVRVDSITFDDVMAVPGCFDATPKYAGRRGVAAYRVQLRLDSSPCHRLEFDSVQHRSVCYCNGVRLGEHRGGYTRFFHDLPAHSDETVELVVLLDNRWTDAVEDLHLEFYDFYQFGGITRTVRLHHLARTHIERIEVTTLALEPPTIRLNCFVRSTDGHIGARFRACLDETPLFDESIDLDSGRGCIERELSLPRVLPWSPEQPNLHLLCVQLDEDDFNVRWGMRLVKTEKQQLLINGEPVFLKGVNRHEAHPLHGCATSDAVKLADLQLLKELGCNFLRGSHYPQDETLLDLCDEMGIVVFEEAIGWQNKATQLTSSAFIAAQRAHIDAMLDQDFNHPSVILWGVLNEGESQNLDSRPAYDELLGHIRARDPSRLVTYASNRPYGDQCLDLIDVISVNTYPGWYSGSLESIATQLDAVLDDYRTRGGGRPVLVSEIGASALYGCHDAAEQRWTEEYQAQLLERVIQHLLRPEANCIGICLWQFADTRTSDSLSQILGKPRGYNNKGLLDEYRRKKLAFRVVKSLFSSFPEHPCRSTPK
jgi:beta-glucuronidase